MSNAQSENPFHVQDIDWLAGAPSDMGKVLVFSSSFPKTEHPPLPNAMIVENLTSIFPGLLILHLP
jgi:hypothetical protein